MQTHFTEDQLRDAAVADVAAQLRKCVHCGFCLATCPTYVLLGDERDSPRGRIVLMQHMLEQGGPADEVVVRHVDRCLSCLSCQTTCPSDVNYMHLVDEARAHIEAHHQRPWTDRWLRWMLGLVLPRPRLFRLALWLGALGRPLARWMPGRLRGLLDLAPRARAPRWIPEAVRPEGPAQRRVAVLGGCVQSVVGAEIHEAMVRLLARSGCEVVRVPELGCCGAVTHHLGQKERTAARLRANVRALAAVEGLDAVVADVAGCGTMLADYGHLLRDDPELAEAAAAVSAKARDIVTLLAEIGLPATRPLPGLRVVYQSSCSLQHGQGVRTEPVTLLREAGFEVVEPAEAHLCCGSAGTYSLLQPEIAARLGTRKAAALEATGAAVVASANVGCMLQLRSRIDRPIVHTVQLLDWATGGPDPLKGRATTAGTG